MTGNSVFSSPKYLGVFTVALVLGLCFETAYATNGYFRHGYGMQYRGLAGAGAALYLSPLGVATNPAVLSFLGSQLDIGFSLFNPNREYTVTGNPSGFPFTFPLTPGTVESDSKLFLIPTVGISYSLQGGNALGLAIFGNGGMNTDYPVKTFDTPQLSFEPPTGVDLSQLFVAATYARRFGKNHAVGISGIFVFQRFRAEGLFAFGGFSSDPSKLTNNEHSNSTGFGARIGYLGEFGVLSVGGSYQTKFSMSEFDEYAGLFAEQGGFDIPATWTAGIAVKASPKVTLAADIQQIMYSDIASVGNPLDLQNNPPFVPNPNPNPNDPNTFFLPNQNFKPLGDPNGWGFGWDDMTVVKFGVQLEVAPEFMLRGGFSTGGQPIPESEVMFNILAPGVIENHITLGLSAPVSDKVKFNFAFMHALSKSVTGPNPFEAPNQQQIELKMNQFEADLGVSITL